MTPFDTAAAAAWLSATTRNSSLSFTPEALQTAAEQLAASVERDADGQLVYTSDGYASAFRVEKNETVEIPVNDFVAALILQNAKPVPKTTPAGTETRPEPALPSSAPRWAQISRGPISDVAKALAAQHDAAVIREAEGWENPFIPGPNFNRTRQQVIINKHPVLAARFRKEASA